jgi:class 3 adenylate cyclase
MPHDKITAWLQEIGLEQFAGLFAEQQIELDDLPDLSEHDLEKLGIPLGPRKRLARAITTLSKPVAAKQAVAKADPVSAPGEPHGERRQLTVLFCDLVGYTELTSRLDPEVLQAIMRSYEDICAAAITRYEGYVFQRLGDGIVAFFGYPLAHEGEAERAVRAGLAVIASLGTREIASAGRLEVRIGIATGLVVVSSAAKSAVGETMNLAARLQAISQPGSIVVSERVRRLAGGAFDYEDLGEQTLKGIAQPTHAHRILGVSEAASRFEAATGEGLTPLVGRELELGLLLER